MDNMNDAFKALAKEVESEERDRAAKRASGGGSSFTFETIKWTGLEKNVMKVVRALGGVPNSGDSPFTARTIRHASIMSDKNKKMQVNLPSREEQPDWILWKVIDKVMDVDWVDKKKVYPVERTAPHIFNIVAHNGFAEGSPQHKFDKGWAGRDYFIFNCLDRSPEVYKWSTTNKHSVLLSKQVNTSVGQDGKILEFPDPGVPAYGFVSLLAMNIFKHYGDWRNYDLGITRTGLMETPMRVINASKYIEEVPEELQALVSSGPLTEEEKSWSMYDLDKLFGVSSYTKLWNNLKLTFAKIDMELGTHFVDELKSFADEEAAKRQAEKAAETPDEEEEIEDSLPKTQVVVEQKVEARPPRKAVEVSSNPPAWDQLNDEEKSYIVSSSIEGIGPKWNIVYSDAVKASKRYACTGCGTVVPEEFMTCPACGIRW
jgi:hypothetical protein